MLFNNFCSPFFAVTGAATIGRPSYILFFNLKRSRFPSFMPSPHSRDGALVNCNCSGKHEKGGERIGVRERGKVALPATIKKYSNFSPWQ
jgi:hypothetical protein